MSKAEYIRDLLKSRVYHGTLMQAALVYWHSGIPLAHAFGYMDNLEKKLKL